MKQNLAGNILVHLTLIVAAAISLVPFVWLICACFKQGEDLFQSNFLPASLSRLTLNNFHTLFTREHFGRWMVNSIFLASAQTCLVVVLSSLGGFALCKYQFAGKRLLMLVLLLTLMIPAPILIPSGYELMRAFDWLDSYLAILIPGAASVFGAFLFKQAMQNVPDELLHAGRIDGCSELRLWWEIALPIVRPMTGAFTLMSFLGSWNSYLWPQIVLMDESKYTLPMGLANMMRLQEYQNEYGVLMCGTLLSILPVLLLFFALQKDFIAGLASGAVKG